MRFRPWLMLAGLLTVAAVAALPAAAQDRGFDQPRILSELGQKLAEPVNRPHGWLDIGTSLPIGRFQDRDWDPGLFLRWNQEVWASGSASLVGSAGLAFNDESRYNEAQIDSAYNTDFDALGVEVLSHNHLSIPLAVELQLEPSRRSSISPFVSFGPAMQYTNESKTRRRYYSVVYAPYEAFVVPQATPPLGFGLLADQRINKTHFHLGYQVRAGLRARVGPSNNPIALRLTGSLNTWFEHDRPISLVGAMISFAR